MKGISEIKEELKQIQVNFNPEKLTYKIIDSILKEDMSTEEIIKSLYSIKGTSKYPEDIRSKYYEIIASLQCILADEKEELNKREQEQKTQELKDLINTLEERKKEKSVIKEKLIQKDNLKEKKEESFDEDLKLVPKVECIKDNSKKVFTFLLVLIAICIVVGVLLIIFM